MLYDPWWDDINDGTFEIHTGGKANLGMERECKRVTNQTNYLTGVYQVFVFFSGDIVVVDVIVGMWLSEGTSSDLGGQRPHCVTT